MPIHIRKQWLTLVEFDKFHLRLDDDGILNDTISTLEYREFRALNIDFDEVDVTEVRDIVKPYGFHRMLGTQRHKLMEILKFF